MSITADISTFVTGCLNGASLGSFPTLAKLQDILLAFRGTQTNDNAAAGEVGEYVESTIASGSAVGLTSFAFANVTTISLTAGDWDVSGAVIFGGSPTGGSFTEAGFSTTTLSPGTRGNTDWTSPTVPGAAPQTITLPSKRFSLASTTTIYLVAGGGFTGGTMTAYGRISARRAR